MVGKASSIVIILISLFVLSASSANAAIKTLNGLSGQDQVFSNDTNVGVLSSGTTHFLEWIGLLPISRGGTGASSFTDGSIPFISSGVFTESLDIKWEVGEKSLIIGESGEGSKLILDNGSTLDFSGAELGSQHIYFRNSFGGGMFQISYETEPFDSLFIFSEVSGGGIAISRSSGGIIAGKHLTTGLFPPKGTFQVQGSTDAFDHGSTLYVGGADIDTQTTMGCIALGDTDGNGVTYVTANDGVLTASSTKPSVCQ